METRETRSDLPGPHRECGTCGHRVPANLRCFCEMVQDQRAEADQAVMVAHAERLDTILRRDWRALVALICLTGALVFGAMLARLETDGRKMAQDWKAQNDRMEATR